MTNNRISLLELAQWTDDHAAGYRLLLFVSIVLAFTGIYLSPNLGWQSLTGIGITSFFFLLAYVLDLKFRVTRFQYRLDQSLRGIPMQYAIPDAELVESYISFLRGPVYVFRDNKKGRLFAMSPAEIILELYETQNR